jgi:hypothetical protein
MGTGGDNCALCRVFAIAEAFFVRGELVLNLVDGLVNAAVEVFAFMVGDEGILVFRGDNDFATFHAVGGAVEDQLDGLDEVIVFRQFIGFIFGVSSDGGGDIEVATGNGNNHDRNSSTTSDPCYVFPFPKP